jgi:muconolactone delta-isomerase
MTQKYTHDVQANEVIVEDLTADEVKELKAREKEYKERTLALEAEAEAKAIAKAAILDRLGLTADEAKLLLG